ncbi:acyl-protein thioesterase 2-like [Watersipora subatra]|uniref:acyl-protein thioesterase 2-like n=1 Tax=Watersipora subatra TaxID=2589382 RepID=UPI00355C9850
MSRLPAATISPTSKHTATVIFLHGLGDTGQGWCELFKQGALPWIKYIFPHAPSQPVSLNAGMSMPSWFDIHGLSANSPQDEQGIKKSSAMLTDLIREETKSVPAERIVVGGFSQGGAVALFNSLTENVKLAGVLAFSTWLPLHTKITTMLKDANKRTPILQCHGDLDPVVPYPLGSTTAAFLKQLNPEHELHMLSGVMHSSSPEELEKSKKFLLKCLKD